MSLATDYTAAVDKSANLTLAQSAVARVATAVLSEAIDVQNHAARLAWAQNTLPDTLRMARIMIWGIIADAAVQSSPTDANIIAAVDRIAYVYANI